MRLGIIFVSQGRCVEVPAPEVVIDVCTQSSWDGQVEYFNLAVHLRGICYLERVMLVQDSA